jgi:hypothetical protein
VSLLAAVACADDEPRASGVPPSGGAGTSSLRPPGSGFGSGGGSKDAGGPKGGSGAVDAGTSPERDAAAPVDGGPSPRALRLPPANAAFDYQLGGAYAPLEGVEVVARDRTERPAPVGYNICYVNGFQVQPGEESFWLDDHPDLVLRDASGEPVIDVDWDELLIDVSTPDKRDAVVDIVAEWIEGCAAAGFDAVEIDNLDAFTRSEGLLVEDDAVATMAMFSEAAHAAGLAIAQKNAAELVRRRFELGTDFAVAEECNRYSECGVYVEGYDDLVFVIEYRRADFEDGCAGFPDLSIVLRDLELNTPASAAYVYDGC